MSRALTLAAFVSSSSLVGAQSYDLHRVARVSATNSVTRHTGDLDHDGALDIVVSRGGRIRYLDGFSEQTFEINSSDLSFARYTDLGTFNGVFGLVATSNTNLHFFGPGLASTNVVPIPPGHGTVRGVCSTQFDSDPLDEVIVTCVNAVLVYDIDTGNWTVLKDNIPATEASGFSPYGRQTSNGPVVGVAAIGTTPEIREYDVLGNQTQLAPLPAGVAIFDQLRKIDDDHLAWSFQASFSATQPGGELHVHDLVTNTTTKILGAPPMRFPSFTVAEGGELYCTSVEVLVDERISRVAIDGSSVTPILQAVSGTGLQIADAYPSAMFPGCTRVLQVQQTNLGVHDFYAIDGPVDVQTFDKLVTTGNQIHVDVRCGAAGASSLVVPLISFAVPQLTPTPWGNFGLLPDGATLLGPQLMGWQLTDAAGAASFALTVPAGGGGNVFPIAFGWACFPAVGQPFLNQSSCTTGMVSF
ncbi:MAG: hypothetical protein KDC98_00320 [Planctomycetes bacterium]|nr:hypothetical protein [Planctomycetota bacterium]